MALGVGLASIRGDSGAQEDSFGLVALCSIGPVLAVLLLVLLSGLYFGLHLLGQPDELLPLMRPYLLVNMVSLPFVCWMNTFKQFFDAVGDTKTPMVVLVGGNVVNIAGNWLLIYGVGPFPELGLLGAGISTLVSRVGMAAAFALLFFFSPRCSAYSEGFRAGGLDRHLLWRVNALGWPLALQMGMESAAFSLSRYWWVG